MRERRSLAPRVALRRITLPGRRGWDTDNGILITDDWRDGGGEDGGRGRAWRILPGMGNSGSTLEGIWGLGVGVVALADPETAGSFSALATAALILSISTLGVPAGANKPNHESKR